MNKISLKEFIEIYDNSDEFNIDDYVKHDYVSIEDKINKIYQILGFGKEYQDEDIRPMKSIVEYIVFNLMKIDMFTYIEIDFGDATGEYDWLQERDLFTKFYEYINKDELKQFDLVVTKAKKDYNRINHSIESYANRQVNKLLSLAKPIIDIIEEEFKKEQLKENSSNTDVDNVK